MKKLPLFNFILLAILLLCQCKTPQKLTRSGQHDEAIVLLNKKLARNKMKENNVLLLEEAFTKANNRDLELIKLYQIEGRPDRWDEINIIYQRIDKRQKSIEPLLPLYVKTENRKATLAFINIADDLVKSKENAATFYYNNALSLLKKGNKTAARSSYYEFEKLKQYYPNYKDANDLQRKAHAEGINFVLYRFKNEYRGILPAAFEDEIMRITLEELNTLWVNYHVIKNNQQSYDYEIVYKLKDIQISPESNKERSYEDTKKVQDGWEYVLDSKGNVKKDSVGNDLKTPKYKVLKAQVLEVLQQKSAVLVGELAIFNTSTNQLVRGEVIGGEQHFENYAATFRGDKEALCDESKRKIGNSPMPFPSNEAMAMGANSACKPIIKSKIIQLTQLFEK